MVAAIWEMVAAETANAAAVDTLLRNLSQDLHDAYGVPLPDAGVPEEPETSGSGEGAE